MEARFPSSKRTYTPLKDMQVCGGDLNMARASVVFQNPEFWNRLIETRKNPAAQAAMLGPGIIFKFIFQELTIDDVVKRVADKLSLKGRALICPYPEIGMDVDKPHQLEIMRADLAKQARRSASTKKSSPKRKTAAKAKPKPARKPIAKKPVAKGKAKPAKKVNVAAKSRHKSKKK